MSACFSGPLIRCPSLAELAVLAFFLTFLAMMEMTFCFAFNVRPGRQHVARVAKQFAFQLALMFIRSDARLVILFLYLAWNIGRHFPWKRWKNTLGSKLGELTEVVRASLRRQQNEAFG